VPGLKVEQLQVFSDAVGDAGSGADAAWGASGKISFNGKLRNWLKMIVESEYGWGRLPARGADLFITFVAFDEPPSKEGDATAVVHHGVGDKDSLTQPGTQVQPGSGDRVVHTHGLFKQGGQVYTQHGTSPGHRRGRQLVRRRSARGRRHRPARGRHRRRQALPEVVAQPRVPRPVGHA
jgi:hypothetical protein